MLLLFGIRLRILTPINMSVYRENLQPFVMRFFQDIGYHYISILDVRRRHTDALLLINVCRGAIFCPSVLDAVGLRVPSRNIRKFFTYSCCSSTHCPTARCVAAANSVCEFVDHT
jgi:hypothetical protein